MNAICEYVLCAYIVYATYSKASINNKIRKLNRLL